MRASGSLNLLLINHGALDTNSAYHVLGHAQALAASGHDVRAGMTKLQGPPELELDNGLRVMSHRVLLDHGGAFRDGRPADVVHVWTPRENVRQFTETYRQRHGGRVLIIHLEDPESVVFERFTGHSLQAAREMPKAWPSGLICPSNGQAFLQWADGFTVVHACLQSEVPVGRPCQELVPVLDTAFFEPHQDTSALRAALGLADHLPVVAFHGNDHPAVAQDVRCLYEAMDRLMAEGWEGYFVRTGHVNEALYEDLPFRSSPRCLELGFVERSRIPGLMALATVVVQPGNADPFNAHRLPAKIPEYLMMARPLIMGRTNIAAELQAQGAARIVDSMTALSLAQALRELLADPSAAGQMGQRGRDLALARFSAARVTPALLAFYQQCLAAQR